MAWSDVEDVDASKGIYAVSGQLWSGKALNSNTSKGLIFSELGVDGMCVIGKMGLWFCMHVTDGLLSKMLSLFTTLSSI